MQFTQTIQTFTQSFQKSIQNFGNESITSTDAENWDPTVLYGGLWEQNENTDACRECGKNFQIIIVRKHHCRVCAGIFCDECCLLNEAIPARIGSALFEDNAQPCRICGGCRRNETPGEDIRNAMRRQIERFSPQKEKSETVDKMAMRMAIQVGGVLGTNFSEYSRPRECHLRRLSTCGDEKQQSFSSKGPPPSGYFEILNKSDEVFCVKVLISGSDRRFEVPRPSYMAVPPNHAVSADFDANNEEGVEGLDIIILFNNPAPVSSKNMVYDTANPAVPIANISPCAQVDQFRNMTFYVTTCLGKNVLLKYKGHGALEPRRGDSVSRVGIWGKMKGSRGSKSRLDFSTNIETLEIAFSC